MKNNKIAIVTGGSRGIGRNIATSLAQNGVDIIFTYHSNKAEAEVTAKVIEELGQKAGVLQLDVSDSSAFEPFAKNVQKLLTDWNADRFDFLINNAGAGLHAPFEEVTEADFDKLYNTSLKGVYFLTQKLLPLINDGGRIINVSSVLTRVTVEGESAYAAIKGASEIFSRYLAKELGPRRITVNAIAPGPIETDFGGGFVRDMPEFNKMVADDTALGRAGLPDDIGPIVTFLTSENGRWITGQRIEASGGMSL